MESTGLKDKIQISVATADLLVNAGKSHWVIPRTDSVEAKGKGVLQTYWLDPGKSKVASWTAGAGDNADTSSRTDSHSEGAVDTMASDAKKHDRLIDWMVELLLDSIRYMVCSNNINH